MRMGGYRVPQVQALSHEGRRPYNEEAVLVAGQGEARVPGERLYHRGALLALADGPSGPQLLQALLAAYYRADNQGRITDGLRRALVDAAGESGGNATALLGAVVEGERLFLGHAGQARAYLLRDGRLHRLTHEEGEASLAQPDIYRPVRLQQGDRLLLCSDGLYRALPAAQMARLASTAHPAESLLDAARRDPGADNVSAVVATIPAPGPTVFGLSYAQFAVWVALALVAVVLAGLLVSRVAAAL